ncbi:MAG: acylneuraminate cytidylyltransferase family protein [Proteobacteria bacterium]|nr:acylneuraminate cytidylyltransferase family protein [Pseudomonadota bacterium]MBU1738776.1 acylneuraminate cytidylyltransferase family protein [Pseudomonadota bacterium]
MKKQSESNIAFIPARGGSKRLPKKNVIDFMGRPMFVYTVESALESDLFGKVVVSSDDDEILSISEAAGAEISVRPPHLATDEASVVEVCLDLLENERVSGRLWNVMTCLYATAPLRGSEDIRKVVELIVPGECEFAMAVSRYHFPPQQALTRDKKGFLVPMWPDLVAKRSQDIPSLVVDNGSTYATLAKAFLQEKTFYGTTLKGVEMSWDKSVDIDTLADLELALYYASKGIR